MITPIFKTRVIYIKYYSYSVHWCNCYPSWFCMNDNEWVKGIVGGAWPNAIVDQQVMINRNSDLTFILCCSALVVDNIVALSVVGVSL